jgi:hypothetical protein
MLAGAIGDRTENDDHRLSPGCEIWKARPDHVFSHTRLHLSLVSQLADRRPWIRKNGCTRHFPKLDVGTFDLMSAKNPIRKLTGVNSSVSDEHSFSPYRWRVE